MHVKSTYCPFLSASNVGQEHEQMQSDALNCQLLNTHVARWFWDRQVSVPGQGRQQPVLQPSSSRHH
jgi:hypothetical protein